RCGRDLAVGAAIADLVEAELVEPLPAAAARGGGDADRFEVAGPAAGRDRGDDRALLCAHAERIGRVLDVHTRELASVACPDDSTHQVVRIRRVGPRGGGLGLLDELAHPANWKRARVVSVPSRP